MLVSDMTASTASATILSSYNGAKPPSPDWFRQALERTPGRHMIESGGTNIEYFTWGSSTGQGFSCCMGRRACPVVGAYRTFFADDFRIAAMSMAGMGGSDWREEYSIAQHAVDMRNVAESAGLFAKGKPVVAGHSFGGVPTATAASDPDGWVGRAFIIDSSLQIRHSPGDQELPQRARRFFGSVEEGLGRFRFLPPQNCDNHYIADMIARNAIVEVEPGRWSWCFDPDGFGNTRGLDSARGARSASCPLAIIYGDRSAIMDDEAMAHLEDMTPDGTPFIAIPDSGHHVMVDQPLALVAAMRALLAS